MRSHGKHARRIGNVLYCTGQLKKKIHAYGMGEVRELPL
jgi:hypothetical protein